MQASSNGKPMGWWKHIAIAGTYCLALVIFRQLSIPHWIILTGFHLSVLLLVDYKYWGALLVGETARLAYVSLTCLHQFGLTWALVNLIPSILWMMPVVWVFRERGYLFPNRDTVSMGSLMLCSLLVAFIATFVTMGQILITPLPQGYVLHYGEVLAQLTLGNFLGVLTVTPSTLAARQLFMQVRRSHVRFDQSIIESQAFFECVFLVIPILAFLIWIGSRNAHVQEIGQMAMFIPVVWLALRHGWKGAAVGGTLASIGIMLLMPARNDHSTLEAETLVAMAISTMLLVGSRIALLDGQARHESTQVRAALALAQRNVSLGEAQLRVAAVALEQVREGAHDVFNMMLLRLKHLQPAIDDAGYRRYVFGAQDQMFRLADSLYPSQLRERSLPSVLREGMVARILDEGGIAYFCDIRGPISNFSQAIHVALYRILCEAITDACGRKNVTNIRVRIRCGCRTRRWIVLQLDAWVDPVRLPHAKWDEVLPRLHRTTTGLGRKAIEDRAATFEGCFREQDWNGGKRISVLLLDPRDLD